ncbi:MAG: Holliday junction branch migration protein RuvA [Ignavibacteria bacterium]|nr:MAG: Holliday junction branch migration protein RuvA [Ignavibacteria bacterium]
MIEFLNGILRSKDSLTAVVEVQGVGYHLSISLPTSESLPEAGEPVLLLTHLHVREDAMLLFGFHTAAERQLFRQLQTISGIGARMALNILSGIAPEELRNRVSGGDIAALTRIPGIGKKTAERIIVELRDTFARQQIEGGGEARSDQYSVRDEALMALIALGYPKNTAEKAISAALKEKNNVDLSVAEILKAALREANSR